MIGHYSQLAHQGISDPSRSMANGGGSGGGSENPDTRYAQLDALYGTQNQASQFMLNNAMPHVPQLTQNSIDMNAAAMNGTLANQMREQAGNEAQANFGAALGANDRNMQRYGMGMNANRIMSENNRNAIMGAASKTGAMNRAGASAEDMKWNRNAATFGQVMGMNNGALQNMNSTTAGMANTANQMNANDQRNAAGYGQAGAAFGSALMKADGGMINAPRLASGGDAWQSYKAANPVQPMGSSGGGKRTSPYAAMLGGAAPSLLGMGAKDVLNLDGKGGKLAKSVKGLYDKYQGATTATTTGSGDLASMVPATEYIEVAPDLTALGGVADGTGAIVGTTEAAAATDAAMAAAATTQTAAELATAADITSAGLGGFAKGGCVKKANAYAMGGLANTSVASSNKIDNSSGLAQMDASGNMSVAKMGTSPTSSAGTKMETHAKPVLDTQYSGKTDGMGESSDGDPDGFGVHSGDNRHMAGKATMSVVGRWLGGPLGGMAGSALAEVLHPVGEAVSRTVISAGDKVGGPGGALVLDPIGTTMSGKYSNKELAKGHASVALGMPWLSKFADGGRVDHTDGGDVQGPGTETSDDIPAWLSDGEYVLNADAVKLVGKKKLDKINNAGLAKREGKPVKDGNALMLAGGGFLGGNLGIAMGAGVDQWNRQQMIDQRDQEMELRRAQDARQNEQFNWQRQQHETALKKQERLDQANTRAVGAIGDATAMSGLPDQLRARVAAGEITQEEANGALRQYGASGYSPDSLARKAGLEMASVDLGKGMDLQKQLLAQNKAAKMERAGALMGSGNYAGLADVMSNNDFNPDGRGYKFAGVTQDKAGNKLINFSATGPDGKAQTHSVDERLLPGMVEATLDGTKGIEYTKEVGRIKHQDRQDNRADRATAISGGHLGLAQAKWNKEKASLTTEKEIKAKVLKLKTDLADTKDEAARAVLKQKIEDLAGSAKTDYRYHSQQSEDADGRKVTNVLDRSTGIVYEGGIKPAGQSKPTTQYVKDKVYTDANGNKAKWNGTGWDNVK